MKKRKPGKETPAIFAKVTAQDLESQFRKTKSVNIRLSEAEKTSMDDAKEALGMSLTDYLIACHRSVSRHLK